VRSSFSAPPVVMAAWWRQDSTRVPGWKDNARRRAHPVRAKKSACSRMRFSDRRGGQRCSRASQASDRPRSSSSAASHSRFLRRDVALAPPFRRSRSMRAPITPSRAPFDRLPVARRNATKTDTVESRWESVPLTGRSAPLGWNAKRRTRTFIARSSGRRVGRSASAGPPCGGSARTRKPATRWRRGCEAAPSYPRGTASPGHPPGSKRETDACSHFRGG